MSTSTRIRLAVPRAAIVAAVALAAGVAAAEPDARAPEAKAAKPEEHTDANAPKPGEEHGFDATAYSQPGKTADGTHTRKGVVAADPDVLPLGSEIQVKGAGEHSGKYRVEDTGPAVQGKKIDVFVPSEHKAKQFGRKHVKVKVLRRGDDARQRKDTPETRAAQR